MAKKKLTVQGECPKCGGELNYSEGPIPDGEGVYYECECRNAKCGFVGQEQYNCVFSGFSNEGTGEWLEGV